MKPVKIIFGIIGAGVVIAGIIYAPEISDFLQVKVNALKNWMDKKRSENKDQVSDQGQTNEDDSSNTTGQEEIEVTIYDH